MPPSRRYVICLIPIFRESMTAWWTATSNARLGASTPAIAPSPPTMWVSACDVASIGAAYFLDAKSRASGCMRHCFRGNIIAIDVYKDVTRDDGDDAEQLVCCTA